MNLKLIVALVADEKTEAVIKAAREGGATGSTIINNARGEGLNPEKSFLGLDLTTRRDLILFIVAGPRARDILETIAEVGKFEEEPGSGVAFQLSIDDAIGLGSQTQKIIEEIEEAI